MKRKKKKKKAKWRTHVYCLLTQWLKMQVFIILCHLIRWHSKDIKSQEKTVRESMEQKAVTCDLQEQPKLICLWLDTLLSRADRCRLALLKLWLNCTQQTGYRMTGALLKMSTRSDHTAALAWCRPPKTSTDSGGFFHHRSKVFQVGNNRFRGEGRENECRNHALSARKHLELNEG